MIKIAEAIPSQVTPLWKLAKQAGVDYAVGGLPLKSDLGPNDTPYDYMPLLRMKKRYEEGGFKLEVIEARPPMDRLMRGLPGRDEELEYCIKLIQNMGRLEIPVWCSVWMAVMNWTRTNVSIHSRGGSLVTGFNLEDYEKGPANPTVTEEELWKNLEYFLKATVPAAEEAGVVMAMHPDDPPLSPLNGVGRIMSSVENFQRMIDLVPSKANGVCLCQGNFTLMTDDLPAAIRKFGQQGKIHFVHFRDVKGDVRNFQEAWHDDGITDMRACLEAYRDIGFEGVLRPDHVPTVEGDSNDNAGYSSFGRLYAIGYIRGLREAVYGKKHE
jgi:mannonate dehydratase